METLLSYDQQEAERLLRLQGWFPSYTDDQNGLDFASPLTANNTNDEAPHADFTALTTSKKATLQLSKFEEINYPGAVFRTLIFKPHCNIFHLSKPLIPRVELKIWYIYNALAFFRNGVGLAGRLQECDMKLNFHVCQL